MIKIENLNYKYKTGEFALSNISLHIKENEFVCIIGQNGSGKSTFSKLISGLSKFKNGKIVVNNLDLSNKKNALEIRKNIGMVFQNPENQIIFDKVYDDLAFGLKNLGFSSNEIEKNIDNALKHVNMLEYKNAYTTELSLGQKQKIAIACALAIQPKILILDEPTTMLDPVSKNQIYKILKKLKTTGITIVYITNFLDELLLCDRTILFANGKLKKDFLKSDLLDNLDFLESLEFPGIISLLFHLKNAGIYINLDTLSTQELVNKLKDLK